jgi:hypothetical protein
MGRKILAFIALAAFLVFDWACMATKIVPVSSPGSALQKDQGSQIIGIVTKSGKKIEFSEDGLKSVGEHYILVVRAAETKRREKINAPDVKEFIMASGKKQGAIMANGSVYWILSMSEAESGTLMIEYLPDAIAVPFSDVEALVIKKINVLSTVGLGLLALVVLSAVVFAAGGFNFDIFGSHF